MTIAASTYPFANVMPPGRRSEDWVNSISRTLQWNSRQRQKAFQEWEEKETKGSRKERQQDERGAESPQGELKEVTKESKET